LSEKGQIGFSQRIRLEWLECTAGLMLAGLSREDIESALQELLKEQLSVDGTAIRGNREKAITILMKTWVDVDPKLILFRDDGLEFLKTLAPDQRLAVHWGMATAVYPFFGDVAETVGRLARLQGTVSAAQAQRRVREKYGERETVSRAARRVLRAFMDWGVLEETGRKGLYKLASTRAIESADLAGWLVEAYLRWTERSSGSMREILAHPVLFPFRVEVSTALNVHQQSRLEIVRQGLDGDLMMLRSG
jgi:hypothetical protein